jgi:hypothetical protein
VRRRSGGLRDSAEPRLLPLRELAISAHAVVELTHVSVVVDVSGTSWPVQLAPDSPSDGASHPRTDPATEQCRDGSKRLERVLSGVAGSAAVLAVLDLIGVFANAILGGSVARRHRLDPIGFAALAIVSGLGGGIIRDVLRQQGPPVALPAPPT